VFSSPDYDLVCSLWAMATHLYPKFDCFPYCVVTADVKQSGKTRLSELVGFMASNPRSFAAMTPAALFRIIRDESPTLILDEAETLSSEAASVMRAVLNVGYRQGQTIPRIGKSGVEEWPAYCPKMFVLIGDVYDTLRDRSVVIRMTRGQPKVRFFRNVAMAEGNALADRARGMVAERMGEILTVYERGLDLSFLTSDRDMEIWSPLFAVCKVFAPHRFESLKAICVDMATEKTHEARRYVNLLGAEKAVEDDAYARRLVRDLAMVFNGHDVLYTDEALQRLRSLPTAPWRKFRGPDGLDAIAMANLLSRFNIAPKLIKTGSKKRGSKPKVARGYRKDDVVRALPVADMA
jgi:hypothetical protein